MKNDKGSISIKQLASRLNLSSGTVSLVLNGRGNEMRISKATQERVLEAALKLGFKSDNFKLPIQENDKNRRLLIRVFTPHLKDVKNVLGSILYGIQSSVIEENLPAEIIIHPYCYGRLVDSGSYLSSEHADGAVICGLSDEDVAFLLKESFDIPIILFNRTTEKYGSVYVDDYDAGMKAALLFKQKGHKNAGLIMPDINSKACSLRQLGFIDGCKKLGLDICSSHIQKDELSASGGYSATVRLLELDDYPSALFVLISEMAVGAVKAIKERGAVIPADIEMVTYGVNQFEEFMSPSLTTIQIPVETIAAECLRLVLEMIKTKDYRPVSRIQPLSIAFRESCAEL